MSIPSLCASLAAGLGALVLAGCGSATANAPASTQVGAKTATATWELIDISPSFRPILGQFLPQMESVVLDDVEPSHGRILAGAIDGSPLTTAKLTTLDFSAPPPLGITDPDTIARFRVAEAYGFTRKLGELIHAHAFARGSGILDGLLLTLSDPGDVYAWTDGIDDVPGFNLYGASDQDVDREIARYASRFRGRFRGHIVTIIGVGRGAPNATVVERARRLFETLVVRIGDGDLRWLQTLTEVGP